jgi:hypothetical protein
MKRGRGCLVGRKPDPHDTTRYVTVAGRTAALLPKHALQFAHKQMSNSNFSDFPKP